MSSLCRITLALIGLSWLIIGTILVGFLPESRYGWERASGLSCYSSIHFLQFYFFLNENAFPGFLPVRRAGWASWCTWPATGSVLEACQPPSTTTTGQFKPSACTWQDSLTKAWSVCPPQRKQTPEGRNLCSQSHLAHRRGDSGQRWLLRHGEHH